MPLAIEIIPEPLAVSRLPADAALPEWAHAGPFVCHARTPDELSIVCSQEAVPPDARASRGWRALKLVGPFDFSLVGILLEVAQPLARAEIGILSIATYDTDYVLVPEASLEKAVEVLEAAGHEIRPVVPL